MKTRCKVRAVGAMFVVAASMLANAAVAGEDWKQYPFDVVPGMPTLQYPTVEGQLTKNESDTWYFEMYMRGQQTGKDYAAMTIINKNHIGAQYTGSSGNGLLRADFHEFALFDITNKSYGTYTEFDYPPLNLLTKPKLQSAVGYMDMTFKTKYGTSVWKNSRNAQGELMPFQQEIDLTGKDQTGKMMRLKGFITYSRAPYPQGGDALNGVLTCFGQPNTLQYGQAGLMFKGTITLAGVTEEVVGTRGHYDRQIFPSYVGAQAGFLGRDRSHRWRSPQLEDGTDLSMWWQYLRTQRNEVVADSGITVNEGGVGRTATTYTEDMQEEILSYVRFPFDSLPTLPIPAVSKAVYMAAKHKVTSKTLGMELIGTPLVPNPAHVMPVPYSTGPTMWEGTFRGRQVKAIGFSETTLGLYRDWELVKVLKDSVMNLPTNAYAGSNTSGSVIAKELDIVNTYIDTGKKSLARSTMTTKVRPLLQKINEPSRSEMNQIYTDLYNAI